MAVPAGSISTTTSLSNFPGISGSENPPLTPRDTMSETYQAPIVIPEDSAKAGSVIPSCCLVIISIGLVVLVFRKKREW